MFDKDQQLNNAEQNSIAPKQPPQGNSGQDDSQAGNKPTDNQPTEPEDIFQNSDPDKASAGSNQSAPSQSEKPQAFQPKDPNQQGPSADQGEPVIKSSPSMFNKQNPSDKGQSQSQSQSSDDSRPAPKIPDPTSKMVDKKKIIIVVFVVLLIGAGAAAGWWYYTTLSTQDNTANTPANSQTQDQPTQPNENTDTSGNGNLTDGPSDTTGNQPSAPLDSDGDGLTDEQEATLGTNIHSSDTDNDGLFDKEEVEVYETDPLLADTDGDGINDGDEVKNNQDPLTVDNTATGDQPDSEVEYTNQNYNFGFNPLAEMVFERESNNVVQFNDNVNQTKLYIYLNGTQPADLEPDVRYSISQDQSGAVMIAHIENLPDRTPYSTDLATELYQANNGMSYLIRYVATKRAPDHREKFETILQSFKFL